MKKYLYLAALICLGFSVTSCKDTDEPTLITKTATFEDASFNALIDNPQYNGKLLYGDNAKDYAWKDEATSLSGALTLAWGGLYGFAEGGSAISNYIDADLQNHATYEYQLAVPQSNGSNNFVVVFCDATIKFADEKSHIIQSMDISPTTYLLGVMKNGDAWGTASLANGGYLTLVMTADTGKKLYLDLARNGVLQETWKTIDLSSLGAVNSLTFTMNGSDTGDYGLNTPAYFAFDNVVVVP
ncbi:MAG: DUF4465 domain-containing protein [Bacteroidaceae bacterium]|nr:DUF4465 domain-containing protein [Bacteroidaceae bacterium]